MAEGVGFEPTRACALPVFKTGAINHSTTPPMLRALFCHLRTGLSNRAAQTQSLDKLYVHVNLSMERCPSDRRSKFGRSSTNRRKAHEAIHGRGASWSPANRFEKLHVDLTRHRCRRSDRGDRRTAAARDTIFSRRHQNDHRSQQQPGCRLRNEHQSISRMRARMHLLLCAADARVSRLLGGARFRESNHGQEDAPQLLEAELSSPKWEPQNPGHERCD